MLLLLVFSSLQVQLRLAAHVFHLRESVLGLIRSQPGSTHGVRVIAHRCCGCGGLRRKAGKKPIRCDLSFLRDLLLLLLVQHLLSLRTLVLATEALGSKEIHHNSAVGLLSIKVEFE